MGYIHLHVNDRVGSARECADHGGCVHCETQAKFCALCSYSLRKKKMPLAIPIRIWNEDAWSGVVMLAAPGRDSLQRDLRLPKKRLPTPTADTFQISRRLRLCSLRRHAPQTSPSARCRHRRPPLQQRPAPRGRQTAASQAGCPTASVPLRSPGR